PCPRCATHVAAYHTAARLKRFPPAREPSAGPTQAASSLEAATSGRQNAAESVPAGFAQPTHWPQSPSVFIALLRPPPLEVQEPPDQAGRDPDNEEAGDQQGLG